MITIVGERGNRKPGSAELIAADSEWTLETALRYGAFEHGSCHAFLVGLGLRWTASLNMRPPRTADCSDWNTADVAAARVLARSTVDWVLKHERPTLVLFGRRVHRAFELDRRSMLSGFDDGELKIYTLPHPSGRNRWWNDELNWAAARRLMTRVTDSRY